MKRIKLIAFDLDGVLVDGYGSWWEVHKALGTLEKSREHAKEYYAGKITFDQWAEKDVRLWHGTDIKKIEAAVEKIELMNGIDETLPALKKKYQLAIISGGLQNLADRIKKEYGIKHAVANRLKVKEGKVIGIDQVVDFKGKGKILSEIACACGVKPEECAAVGDYINDIPMFDVAGFAIAFNPKNQEVIAHADETVYEKDLRKILPYFN
jgi:phosphoserine phosphatase